MQPDEAKRAEIIRKLAREHLEACFGYSGDRDIEIDAGPVKVSLCEDTDDLENLGGWCAAWVYVPSCDVERELSS